MPMSAKSSYAWIYKTSLPTVAVIVVYLALYARPMQSELNRLRSECARRTAAVGALSRQASDLGSELAALQPDASTAAEATEFSAQKELLISTMQTSSAQTFARILSIFDSHQLACTQTLRREKDAPVGAEPAAYTLQLEGDFMAVCDALTDIHASVPNAVPTAMSLRRSHQAACCWEIDFEFKRERERGFE